MKFSEYKYERPDVERAEREISQSLKQFKEADCVEKQVDALNRMNDIRSQISTMMDLCHIRHTIDTNDSFYKQEQDYMDEVSPRMEGIASQINEALLASSFREELEKNFGTQLFLLAEAQVKTFSPEVLPLLEKENKLSSQYTQLVASAQIEFQGEMLTLAQIEPFTESADRSVRKEATEARFAFFARHEEQFDAIYDELVKVRTDIARKLGFQNFVELGYGRLNRVDYNAKMVKGYREQIKKYIVPLATKLRKTQAERIGLQELKFYDEGYQFTTGNAKPKGPAEWIVENGQKMYKELSQETNEFFQFMLDHELMDLTAKKGKAGGGYCTYLSGYRSPFIFSNFNGTSGDIDVLTHEAGHAFQVYSSRDFTVPEYLWPTYEACEIHSMSMEFFTWPWMELFFKEDTDKYKYAHLSEAILFLPYGAAVDEFQHRVYEEPELTPAERKAVWKEIEKTYLPHRDYDGIPYLEAGGFWQRQGHIYEVPFYYIDYTLAQVCALQFWKRMQENREKAWEDYVKICRVGGSLSFTDIVKLAGLASPFAEDCIGKVIEPIEQWLDQAGSKLI
ncbi:M3 family oligoendopeptidase [Pseudobacillus wudalianchiensis]|uniref:Oligoendopeptidase F n=1 Tax=Pseudobacillus wudalianchiensis TaxID=1743143 RepID=A0A1B9AT63_9BACI|nr:M3 family oligoendopeptidase [Bacillus wudalianchiensis]OCA87067.1 oligoendopeptidase F [Bacillus wudalianchiensis]